LYAGVDQLEKLDDLSGQGRSRLPVGSSAKSTTGPFTMARAIQTLLLAGRQTHRQLVPLVFYADRP
jgi:hypothetical protein